MLPVSKKYNNQNWLPNIFNDFFDNDWMLKTNATAPAINVLENEKSYDDVYNSTSSDNTSVYVGNISTNCTGKLPSWLDL